MTRTNSFRFLTAVCAMAAAPVAFFALWLLRDVSPGDSHWLVEPWRLIEGGSETSATLRAAFIADLLGRYMLLGPLVVYLYRRLRAEESRLARLASASGTLYIAIGALGSAILASSLPPLSIAWETASGSDGQAIRWIFETLTRIVIFGLNGLLAPLAATVFWTGTGLLLKDKQRFLGVFSMTIGIAAAVSWLGAATSTPQLSSLASPFSVFGVPLWSLVMGLWIWRRATDLEEQSHP